jgi:hypothetical protein
MALPAVSEVEGTSSNSDAPMVSMIANSWRQRLQSEMWLAITAAKASGMLPAEQLTRFSSAG